MKAVLLPRVTHNNTNILSPCLTSETNKSLQLQLATVSLREEAAAACLPTTSLREQCHLLIPLYLLIEPSSSNYMSVRGILYIDAPLFAY